MVDINVAHLKVKADCTKPLPTYAEVERENGDIVPLYVEYPWTPPTCPCCQEIGHLETLCPKSSWKAKKKGDSLVVPVATKAPVVADDTAQVSSSGSTATPTSLRSPDSGNNNMVNSVGTFPVVSSEPKGIMLVHNSVGSTLFFISPKWNWLLLQCITSFFTTSFFSVKIIF